MLIIVVSYSRVIWENLFTVLKVTANTYRRAEVHVNLQIIREGNGNVLSFPIVHVGPLC